MKLKISLIIYVFLISCSSSKNHNEFEWKLFLEEDLEGEFISTERFEYAKKLVLENGSFYLLDEGSQHMPVWNCY